jgi:hypothetical protein
MTSRGFIWFLILWCILWIFIGWVVGQSDFQRYDAA